MNKKTTYFSFIVTLVFVIMQMTSCKKADIKFGEELLSNDVTQLYKVDSFGVNISTVYQDSFITSSSGNLMLGAYTDNLFGRVTTQTYFEVAPPAWTDIYQNTFYDSLVLILKTNGTYYGDSTKPVTINVRELQDSIVFAENTYAFYNTNKFNAKLPILGTFLGNIAPTSNQKITIKLQDALGNLLLNKLKNINDNDVKTTAAFINYFRGLQLTTDATTDLIFNCSDDVVMRLYYRQAGFITQSKTVDFNLNNKSHQFNNISIARTGAISALGLNTTQIPASATGNAAYAQSATGSVIKLTFPSLREIPKIPNFAKVLKATLIIKPLKNSYSTTYFLPPSLRLSQTDINNKIGLDLAYLTSNGVLATQLGFLQTDYFSNEKTQYQYDLTQYVKSVLNSTISTPGEGLLLSPPSPNNTNSFARVVIGDNSNALGNIQLQIFYATIK